MPHHHTHTHVQAFAPAPQPTFEPAPQPAPDGAALLVFAAMLLTVVALIAFNRGVRRTAMLLPPRGKPLQIPYLKIVK